MSQKDFVVKELNTNGFISRNFCLNLYHNGIRPSITRLGAIINILKNEGWDFNTSEKDGDFIYEVKKTPITKTVYRVPELGKEFTLFK